MVTNWKTVFSDTLIWFLDEIIKPWYLDSASPNYVIPLVFNGTKSVFIINISIYSAAHYGETCTNNDFGCRLGMGYNIYNKRALCDHGVCGCNSEQGYTLFENGRCYKEGKH